MSLAQTPAKINPPTNNVVPFPILPLAAGFAVRDSLRKLDAFAKAVLYSLAMRMPNCWPSVERVASDSGMSVRKAQTVLARLEREGVVRRSRQEGRYGTNVYELDLGALREGCTGGRQGCTSCGSEGCTLCTLRGKREKGQDQKRADAGVGAADLRPVQTAIRPQEVRSDLVPNPTPSVRPPAQAEPDHREVGDPDPCTPPESGRFELPDVEVLEPTTADREVAALYRRKNRGEPLVSDPAQLVAAYEACFRRVYGFPSLELRGSKLWKCAVSMARNALGDYFAGDVQEAARYVEWAWRREADAWERGRRRERPMGWRLVFGVMVGDYLKVRQDLERRAA